MSSHALTSPRPGGAALARGAAAFLGALARLLGTAWLEIRLNLFSPAPWIVGGLLATFGYLAVRTSPEPSSFALGWALSREIGPLAAVILAFLAAALANRPQRYDVTELLDSKLAASEEIVAGRWLGMLVALHAALATEFAVTIAAQLIHTKAPVLAEAYALALLRMLPPVLFLSTLAFCLVTVTRNLILGAGLAGLVWFVLYFGSTDFPTVFRIDLSQNALFYYALTAAALLLMLLTYRAGRRAKRSFSTRLLASALALAVTLTVLLGGWATLALPGRRTALAAWERLERPLRENERVPNFAWTDTSGRRVSLAGLEGRPAVIAFIGPRDNGLFPLLRRLSALRQEFAKEQVGVLAVCISDDLNVAGQAARLAGADVPVVTDWGLLYNGTFEERNPCSALAWKLNIRSTPTAMLLGADGRIRNRTIATDEASLPELKTEIREALAGRDPEPETEAAP